MRSLARCRSDDFLDLLAIQCPHPSYRPDPHNAIERPYSGSGGLADKPAQERTRVTTIPATKLTGPVRGRQNSNHRAAWHCAAITQAAAARSPCGLQRIGRTVIKELNNATELDRNGINDLSVAYMSRKMNRLIGYARVSTAGQDLSRQVR